MLLLDFAKTAFRLTSVSFVALVFGFGLLLVCSRRWTRAGRRWLTVAVVLYPVLGMPAVADRLSAVMSHGYRPLATAADAGGATVVVMLGGGITSYVDGDLAIDDLNTSAPRVLEAARVYRVLGDPLVIVSGGNTNNRQPPRPEAAAYRIALAQLGVPVDRILVESNSMTTREEAVIIVPMLRRLGARKFVLVTALSHMRRSLAVFAHEGLEGVPSPARPLAETTGRGALLPSRDGLATSDSVVYECLAVGYYWMRGWVQLKDFRY